MKKSTLITTIAMIVVVVVALSTATYAWFSQATTTSASDSISTTAQADWIIMGGKATAGTGASAGKDVITYSSSNGIDLTMMDGLYSPTAKISSTLDSASNSASFTPNAFFTAFQDGTGLATTAQATDLPTIDPLGNSDDGKVSAVNYVRVINTKSTAQNLVLTITVLTEGTDDSNFYAANAFSTYVTWYAAGGTTGSANTAYYFGTVDDSSTTGEGAGYYVATLGDADSAAEEPDSNPHTAVAESGVNYGTYAIDKHNEGLRAGTGALADAGYVDASTLVGDARLKIGGEVITQGKFYQIKIAIVNNLATNAAVNVAFYAWFDGWALDNTGANSDATVYYEFGAV